MNTGIKLFFALLLAVFSVSDASAVEFIVRGSANEMYDDNINSSAQDPESDWITNLMLGLAIKSEGRSREFNLYGNDYQSYYAKHNQKSTNYQDAGLIVDKYFTENIQLKIADNLQHYPESRDFGTLFSRGEDNTGYLSNVLSLGLSLYITKQFFLDFTYTNGIMNNDEKALADSVYNKGGGGFGYSFNSANIFRIGYIYTLMKYSDGEKTREDQGFAEYERFLTKQLRVILRGGYDYIDSTDGRSRNTNWRASLIDDVDMNNRVNISYLKESTVSSIENDTLDNWQINCDLSHEISGRLSSSISLFYGKGTYQISGDTETLGGASIALAFMVSEFVNFDAGCRYTWNKTEIPGVEESKYDRIQLYAGISGEY